MKEMTGTRLGFLFSLMRRPGRTRVRRREEWRRNGVENLIPRPARQWLVVSLLTQYNCYL